MFMDYADKLDMMDDDCDIQGFPLEKRPIKLDKTTGVKKCFCTRCLKEVDDSAVRYESEGRILVFGDGVLAINDGEIHCKCGSAKFSISLKVDCENRFVQISTCSKCGNICTAEYSLVGERKVK
jgi:hypothetical protein